MLESSRAQKELLTDLRQAIAGSEDDALVSQIKLMKSDLKDRLDKSLEFDQQKINVLGESFSIIKIQQAEFQKFTDKLWSKLQDVADIFSKSATEQVINALKEVNTFAKNQVVVA